MEGLQIFLNAEVVETASDAAGGAAVPVKASDPLCANLELSFVKEEVADGDGDGDGDGTQVCDIDMDEVRTKLAVAKSIQELAQKQAAKLKEAQRELRTVKADAERAIKEIEVNAEHQVSLARQEALWETHRLQERILKVEGEAFRSQTECKAAKREAATYRAKLSDAHAVSEGLKITVRAVHGDSKVFGEGSMPLRDFDVDLILKEIDKEGVPERAKVVALQSSLMVSKKLTEAQTKRLNEQEQMLEDRTAYMDKQKKVIENLKLKLERAENSRLMAEMAKESAERAKEDMMKVLLAHGPQKPAPQPQQQPEQSLFSHLESRELSPEIELSFTSNQASTHPPKVSSTSFRPPPPSSSSSYPSPSPPQQPARKSPSPPPTDQFGTDLLMVSPRKPVPPVFIRPTGYLLEGANGFMSRIPPKPKPKPGPGSNVALKQKRPFLSDLGAQPKLKFPRNA
jgi:hypothetical protein